MELHKITCPVRVLIAARGHLLFFEKIKEALELANSSEIPVTVENFYDVVRKKSEAVDCCAIMIASKWLASEYETMQLAIKFSELLPKMVGTNSLMEEQRIVLLHDSEVELAETFCDALGISPETLLNLSKETPSAFFSLTRDYFSSRHRRNTRKRLLPAPEMAIDVAYKKPDIPPPQSPRLAVIVESDRETAENLMMLLIHKATRRQLHVSAIAYNNVATASLAIVERKPFAVSINPTLALGEHGKVETWGGLEILTAAAEQGIPAILRSSSEEKQIRGALNQRRIKAKPDKVVHADLAALWAESMIACLAS